jgi:hypothetical protein
LAHRLVAELERLATEEELDKWALQAWTQASSLSLPDAGRLRSAFEARLSVIQASPREQVAPVTEPPASAQDPAYPTAVNTFAVPKPQRLRDREHLRFLTKQPCLVCGRQPSDPHHLRFAQPRGLGQKVSDEFTVPLCRAHHRELHRAAKEQAWWSRLGIEPLEPARTFWLATHPTSGSA